MDNAMGQSLSNGEKMALWLPFIGGAVFGLGPLFPRFFSNLFGFIGTDGYIFQLAGAACLGYAFPLWCAVRGKAAWDEIRGVVIATLVFNIVSICVCVRAIMAGDAQWIVYAILAVSVVIIIITATLLARHKSSQSADPNMASEISGGVKGFLGVTTAAAFVFGILPLFSAFSAKLFGYSGMDPYIYGQAGAATLGYAVMSLMFFSAKTYRVIRLPLLMAWAFNAVAFLVSLYQLIIGQGNLLVYLLGLASLVFAIGLKKLYRKASRRSNPQ